MLDDKRNKSVKPKLFEASSCNGNVHKQIITTIEEFDAKDYFANLIDKSQKKQKEIVIKFQNDLYENLSSKVAEIKWKIEYRPVNNARDTIDIFGTSKSFVVVIELDKHRADQVAKKFLSRSALLSKKTIFFISLCYPGTYNMPINETKKYFKYCKILSEKIDNEYAGFIII